MKNFIQTVEMAISKCGEAHPITLGHLKLLLQIAGKKNQKSAKSTKQRKL